MIGAYELGMAEDKAELLILAASHNQVDFLRELLDAGVHGTVASTDQWGLTPLHHAAYHGHDESVKLLLSREGMRFGNNCSICH